MRCGFTLVELVIVMVVSGILVLGVTVSIGRIDEDSRLAVTAGRALADLRYAQEKAMAEQKEVNFWVSNSNTYWATYQATGSPVLSSLQEPLQVQLNQGDSRGVVITSTDLGGSRLSFNLDGIPLLNGSPLSNQLTVMVLNGKINIVLYPSGYSVINPTESGCGGGCGGC